MTTALTHETRLTTCFFIFILCTKSLVGSASEIETEKSKRTTAYEEVVVTAQKREERLIDVPVSITVVGEDIIRNSGIQTTNDLSYLVPNLSVTEYSSAQQKIAIRGVGNPAGSSPLVGLYLDEIPLSISTLLQVGLETTDLERVEVLRGPQGTLFGQGSVGGTVRFITKSPQMNSREGTMGLSVYDTRGGGWSEELTAIINIPVLENTLAFRVAATHKDKGGWIDRPASNAKDTNDSEQTNIRLKGLWQASDKLAVNAMGVWFKNDAGGDNLTNIGSVTESNYQIVRVNGSDLASTDRTNEYELYNLTLNYDLGFATLTSSSSKVDVEFLRSSISIFFDFIPPLGSLDRLTTGSDLQLDAFSQEVRLAGNTSALDWVVGVFYADVEENSTGEGAFYVNGIPPFGPPITSSEFKSSESMAIFGNLSYNVTDLVTVSIGTRYFQDDRDFRAGASELQTEKFDNISSRISLSYAIAENSNLYMSISEGFRSGGFNAGSEFSYEPESVVSYEIGVKSSLLDGRLSAEGALFFSRYDEYQDADLNEQVNQTLILNPGEAEIKGIEFSTRMHVSKQISLGFNGNITDTEFTKASLNPATVVVGDPLNAIPEYNYSFDANFDFNWSSNIVGFARIDYSRQGPSSMTNRAAPFVRQTDKSSAIGFLNAQIGAQLGRANVRLFGRNLNNEKRATNPELFNFYSQNRPRAIGIEIGYEF